MIVRLERKIEELARWILDSEHVVAFTGAGISTDSGIPDFRGPDGVWTRRDAGLPAPKWRVPRDQVAPNASHLSLVELQRLGKLQFFITQNTDNLHRRSGIRPELLAELHGNGQLMRCTNCGRSYTREEAGWDTSFWGPGFRTQGPVPGQPDCVVCGGRRALCGRLVQPVARHRRFWPVVCGNHRAAGQGGNGHYGKGES